MCEESWASGRERKPGFPQVCKAPVAVEEALEMTVPLVVDIGLVFIGALTPPATGTDACARRPESVPGLEDMGSLVVKS